MAIEDSRDVIYSIAGITHRGSVRPRNEDAFAVDNHIFDIDMPAPWLSHLDDGFHSLMVADGMGGHAHGAVASRAVLDVLVSERAKLHSVASCRDVVGAANHKLYDLMLRIPGTLAMGTTIVGAAFSVRSLILFNVGDSRSYRYGNRQLLCTSKDDVPSSPTGTGRRKSHAITQSLGGHGTRTAVMPHVSKTSALKPGEAILLCSDGLTDLVRDEEIRAVMMAEEAPEVRTKALLDLALNAGGIDNVTIVIAQPAY